MATRHPDFAQIPRTGLVMHGVEGVQLSLPLDPVPWYRVHLVQVTISGGVTARPSETFQA